VFPTTPTIPHIVYTTQTSCAFSFYKNERK